MQKDRKMFFRFVLILSVMMLALAGCGSNSQEKVSKKIEKRLEQIDGYKARAEMTMKTGQEARKYHIDIWYKKGENDFYRVDLANEEDDNRQTILKNDEGVFVLTPVLNKSFKFQSDWPENNGQPYLYQSLIKDITADKDAVFKATDEHYVFKTKTNYMNSKHLPYQEVYFDKKTFLPLHVKVLNEHEEPLIEVTFHDISINPQFSEADFNREAILGDAGEKESFASMAEVDNFEVLLPLTTKGAELVETEEVELESGKRVISTFKGERNFTLIQEQIEAIPTSASDFVEMNGELVHLGHSIGAITNEMVEWNHQGTHFYLASEDMTMDELIEVASSVYGRSVK